MMQLLELADLPECGLSVAFSPGAQAEVAVGCADGSLSVWAPSPWAETARWELPVLSVSRVGWSANGGWLAGGGEGQQVFIVPPERGSPPTRVRLPAMVHDLCWSPRGATLAVAAGKELVLLDPGGEVRERWNTGEHTAEALAWHPREDGRLATAHFGGLTLWREGRPEPTERLTWQEPFGTLAWHPAAAWIAAGSHEQTLHLWKLPSLDDVMMRGYPGKVSHVLFAYRGERLVTAAKNALVIWTLRPEASPEGQHPEILELHQGGLSCVLASPSGSHLFTADSEGIMALWRFRRGETVLVDTLGLGVGIQRAAWSPRGDRLALTTEEGGLALVGLLSAGAGLW